MGVTNNFFRMNMIQYYLVDSIIKSHDKKLVAPRIPSIDDSDSASVLTGSDVTRVHGRFVDDPSED